MRCVSESREPSRSRVAEANFQDKFRVHALAMKEGLQKARVSALVVSWLSKILENKNSHDGILHKALITFDPAGLSLFCVALVQWSLAEIFGRSNEQGSSMGHEAQRHVHQFT